MPHIISQNSRLHGEEKQNDDDDDDQNRNVCSIYIYEEFPLDNMSN
jgi:hypothetical protein